MESDSDSSDNESPEVVSSVTMKSEREKEIREMFAQKQKLRDEQKLKRKRKTEMLISQKKEKLARKQVTEEDLEDSFNTIPEGQVTDLESSSAIRPVAENQLIDTSSETKLQKPLNKKIYPKFNIVVEPLTKIQNPRAAAAISFKEKRLAKVPRENVASTLISYREKMRVKNT